MRTLEAIKKDARQRRFNYLETSLKSLIKYCETTDLVLTVKLVALKPLAMGNYTMSYKLRRARHSPTMYDNRFAIKYIEDTMLHLIQYCEICELVFTIKLEPKLPLAMGNYKMIYDIRFTRNENL